MDTERARRLGFIARAQARNVLGAVLSFVYFRLIDPLASEPPVGSADVVFFVFGVALLGVIGIAVGSRVSEDRKSVV